MDTPNFVIYSLVDEYLCGFSFGAIKKNAVINNHVQDFYWYMFSFTLGIYRYI